MDRPPAVALTLSLSLLLAAGAARGQYDGPDPTPEPGGNCQAGDVQVDALSALTFSPSQVTINAGQIVCFRNASGIPHNVHAIGLFQCAGACDPNPDNPSDPAGEPATGWVTRLKFDEPGTINYQCDLHVSMGMVGKVTVQGSPAAPGALSFTASGFSVVEGTANATIKARRTGGNDGAVSVQYATANGTATAGSDYTTRTGTLDWADDDANDKSFTVPIANDTAVESNETVLLTLSSPGGGATLGSPSSSTLTIGDNDAPPGPTVPSAPTGLQASPGSTTDIDLAWTDNSNNETEFRIERRPLGGTFTPIATVGANTDAFTVGGLASATFYDFRVRASNSAGNSAYSNLAGASTDAPAGPCVAADGALCVNRDRFQVEIAWRTATDSGQAVGVPIASAPDSGVFYFFSASNLEALVKVLDACALNDRYWVFFAATTNVEFTLTVTDTLSGKTKVYFNPLGTPAPPVQDTGAFATCP